MTSDFDARRLTGLGGSDAPAAIGLSPWRTPYDLWREKVGEGSPIAVSEPMRWGTLLEPVIAAEYARRTGKELIVPEDMLRHPAHSYMIAHIDRDIAGEPRILEIKTAATSRGWGEPGTDEIPMHYLLQVHHYLIVSGAELADIAVLIGGSDFRIYEVRRDDDIADELIRQEAMFWASVEQREPPQPMDVADAVMRWGRLTRRGAVPAQHEEMAAIEVLHHVREQRTVLDEMETSAKVVLMSALGDNGDTLVDSSGRVLCTWKMGAGTKGYTVEPRPPARRFLLK